MENWTGPVEPEQGIDVIRRPDTVSGRTAKKLRGKRWPEPGEIPSEWLEDFSAGTELARKSLELNRLDSLSPDKRLVLRHERECKMYRSIEQAVELPKLRQGFKSVDAFIALAVSALKRRKAHSRYSLEIAVREILQEEGLREGRHFTCRIAARSDRWSGFVFPSEAAYLDPKFPAESLRMLVPETTCTDRWRQVLEEADRQIPRTHLLILQETVPEAQCMEMSRSGMKLVVPTSLQKKFPRRIRSELQSLGDFIAKVRQVSPSTD